MGKITAKQLETARAKAHASIDEIFGALARSMDTELIPVTSDKYNLVITLEGGVTMPIPDQWVDEFASGEFSRMGLDWVIKYCKDCGYATATVSRYQGKAGGARARLRNWLRNKVEWAGGLENVVPKSIAGQYDRKHD